MTWGEASVFQRLLNRFVEGGIEQAASHVVGMVGKSPF